MEKNSNLAVGDLVLIQPNTWEYPNPAPAIVLDMGIAEDDKQVPMFPICRILNLRTQVVEKSYLFRLRLLSKS